MPMYEYACHDCGTFSAMRRMAECSQPTDCPELRRLKGRVGPEDFASGRAGVK